MMNPKEIYFEHIAQTIIANLEKRQMEGFYCPDCASAVEKALSLMPEGSSIGWGGSMTLSESGLSHAIRQKNYQLIDRDSAKTPDEQRRIYGEICMADFFLTSTNAITVGGELVNIDCRGNRAAFLMFGPQNVIVLAGMNKIVQDTDAAIARIKTTAAPPNTVRLNRKTPCAVTGLCGDCHSPDCICCHTVITRQSAYPGRIKVILIGENLGF